MCLCVCVCVCACARVYVCVCVFEVGGLGCLCVCLKSGVLVVCVWSAWTLMKLLSAAHGGSVVHSAAAAQFSRHGTPCPTRN